MYLAGLNSSSKVIIITDASRFKRVEDRKRTSVISVLLDVVFNIADLQNSRRYWNCIRQLLNHSCWFYRSKIDKVSYIKSRKDFSVIKFCGFAVKR